MSRSIFATSTTSYGSIPDVIEKLRSDIAACRVCAKFLTAGVRPVVQIGADARILIAGQAPGLRVHTSGIPFDDASGERLRSWMGISNADFYDSAKIAIVPMAFCYPGKAASGDAPPRPECAATWRDTVLAHLQSIRLTLVIGSYAQKWHFDSDGSVTETVGRWRDFGDAVLPLPHPSPRNNIWLKKNDWFEAELIPELQRRVRRCFPE